MIRICDLCGGGSNESEIRCEEGERASLAEEHPGCGAERGMDWGVLLPAADNGESLLLLAG